MRATDVHDEVDLVTIPSVGKADATPRKAGGTRVPFFSEVTLGTTARRWGVTVPR